MPLRVIRWVSWSLAGLLQVTAVASPPPFNSNPDITLHVVGGKGDQNNPADETETLLITAITNSPLERKPSSEQGIRFQFRATTAGQKLLDGAQLIRLVITPVATAGRMPPRVEATFYDVAEFNRFAPGVPPLGTYEATVNLYCDDDLLFRFSRRYVISSGSMPVEPEKTLGFEPHGKREIQVPLPQSFNELDVLFVFDLSDSMEKRIKFAVEAAQMLFKELNQGRYRFRARVATFASSASKSRGIETTDWKLYDHWRVDEASFAADTPRKTVASGGREYQFHAFQLGAKALAETGSRNALKLVALFTDEVDNVYRVEARDGVQLLDGKFLPAFDQKTAWQDPGRSVSTALTPREMMRDFKDGRIAAALFFFAPGDVDASRKVVGQFYDPILKGELNNTCAGPFILTSDSAKHSGAEIAQKLKAAATALLQDAKLEAGYSVYPRGEKSIVASVEAIKKAPVKEGAPQTVTLKLQFGPEWGSEEPRAFVSVWVSTEFGTKEVLIPVQVLGKP